MRRKFLLEHRCATSFGCLATIWNQLILKSMMIDELAALSQREFESIRNEMATREELKATEDNILRAIERLGESTLRVWLSLEQ